MKELTRQKYFENIKLAKKFSGVIIFRRETNTEFYYCQFFKSFLYHRSKKSPRRFRSGGLRLFSEKILSI